MLGADWYFGLTRKYVVIFGTLFDNINIVRSDSAGALTHAFKVPLTYAPKDKMLTRITQDPSITKLSAINLPMMSFEMTHMWYETDTHLNTIGKVVTMSDDANKMKYQFNPVPYNFAFSLYIYVKNAEDGTKIIEQILPYFTPAWTVTAHLIPEMGITKDIPIVLNNVSSQDIYDGSFIERKTLIWNLDFTLKGYLYGPVREKPIIKFVKTYFYSSTDSVDPVIGITVQPGLTANGEPTSNTENSVDVNTITAEDDYGFCKIIEDNPVKNE